MRFEKRNFALPIAVIFVFSISIIIFINKTSTSGDGVAESRATPFEIDLKLGEELSRLPEPGLDASLLAETFSEADEIPLLHSLLISYEGELVAEKYFNGSNGTDPVNIKSASKTIISALVGIALEEGYLESLDQKLIDFWPEYFDDQTDPLKETITIGHLLNMASGLASTSDENYSGWIASSNWTSSAINLPMVSKPGESMLYSTGDSHLVSAILTKATGMSTYEFAQEHLFGPLDIHIGGWDRDPQGIYFGGNNMAMSPHDLMKFGQTYLNNGYYNGEEVIPSSWVSESTKKHLEATSGFRDFDYGYYWWIDTFGQHQAYFAWGYGGQFIFVIPELDAVAVFTSSTHLRPRGGGHLEQIHDLFEFHIVPMLERAIPFTSVGN
ncbi:MAG: serine hydrolase [Balneolales bacterium]